MYVGNEHLHQLDPSAWEESGTRFVQTNLYGVNFSLNPTMSWQIWWDIPEGLLEKSQELIA